MIPKLTSLCVCIYTHVYVYILHTHIICYMFGFAGLCGNMDCFGRNLSNQGVLETLKIGHLFEFVQVRSLISNNIIFLLLR